MKNFSLSIILLASFFALGYGCSDSNSPSEVMPGAGLGGSTAQFTVYNGQLYLLQSDKLQTYSLQNPAAPELASAVDVGIDAETLFPYSGNLYVGSQNGMHIYSLENPKEPQRLSSYQHITSCDPVVVEGNFAYVTLRNDTPCRFGQNELHILNISDPLHPGLIAQRAMENPQGLAVKDGILYICNGEHGLVVIDAKNPFDLKVMKQYSEFNGYDVIYTPRSLMMVGKDGVVQFDPADPAILKQLSIIPVVPL